MATPSNYYIDTNDFSTAASVWTDLNLTIKAPDGFYSFFGNYRQQLNGILLAIDSCTPQSNCVINFGASMVPCIGGTVDEYMEGYVYLDNPVTVDTEFVIIANYIPGTTVGNCSNPTQQQYLYVTVPAGENQGLLTCPQAPFINSNGATICSSELYESPIPLCLPIDCKCFSTTYETIPSGLEVRWRDCTSGEITTQQISNLLTRDNLDNTFTSYICVEQGSTYQTPVCVSGGIEVTCDPLTWIEGGSCSDSQGCDVGPPTPITITRVGGECTINQIDSQYLITGQIGDEIVLKSTFSGQIQKVGSTGQAAAATSIGGVSALSTCYNDTSTHFFSIAPTYTFTMSSTSEIIPGSAVTWNSFETLTALTVEIVSVNGVPSGQSISGCRGDSTGGPCV